MEKTTTYWLDLVYGHWLHCLTHTLTQFHMQIILSLLRMKASYSVMLKVYSWRFRNPPKTNMPNADRRLRGSFCRSPQHLKDRRKVPDSLSQSIPVTSKKYWPACGTTINQSINVLHLQCLLPQSFAQTLKCWHNQKHHINTRSLIVLQKHKIITCP